MSGFEIAGIVLGALPLVISALNSYSDGISTLKRWRRYNRELRSIVRTLETESVKLQNVCEKLLIGIVPEPQIEEMVRDPFGDLWRSRETERRIRFRLWKGFASFKETLIEIKGAIDEIKTRIDSQNEKKASELKRAMFTLNRFQYLDLMSTIKEGVANLENLTDRNIELEPARRVRFQGKLFTHLRSMSRGIYHAVESSLGCNCRHDISLRLEKRSAKFISTDDDDAILNDLKERKWEEILVKAARATESPKCWPEAPNPSTQPKNRSVGFSSWHQPTGAITKPGDGHHQFYASPETDCSPHIGTIADQSRDNTRKYTVDPIPVLQYEDTRNWPVISLKEVLQQKNKSLHGSPWLAGAISSHDIFFILKRDFPMYDQPFLMKKLPGDRSPCLNETLNGNPGFPLMRNPTLLALGVILIELILGQTIDSLRTPHEESFTASGLLLNYLTCKRLIDQVGMASSNYATAILRCLDGELHNNQQTLESEDFSHEIYSGVVALLEKDLEYMSIAR
ncbi:hypothetical protein GGR58DRAFT_517408 [Xylaria digitata]|nr:hypothetical protein GGR58DRAFT_517408 [Xylaria digitata]